MTFSDEGTRKQGEMQAVSYSVTKTEVEYESKCGLTATVLVRPW